MTQCRPIWLAAAVATAACQTAWARGDELGLLWQRSAWFEEQSASTKMQPDVRFHVNAPLDEDGQPARGTRLIIFALPNGNTLEQTLGCKLTDGLDWHYDIQHVAAHVSCRAATPCAAMRSAERLAIDVIIKAVAAATH